MPKHPKNTLKINVSELRNFIKENSIDSVKIKRAGHRGNLKGYKLIMD